MKAYLAGYSNPVGEYGSSGRGDNYPYADHKSVEKIASDNSFSKKIFKESKWIKTQWKEVLTKV